MREDESGRLDGRVAMVTGAGGGIGRAIVAELCARGGAPLVAFLASDDASFITGQTLSVSGGLTMS